MVTCYRGVGEVTHLPQLWGGRESLLILGGFLTRCGSAGPGWPWLGLRATGLCHLLFHARSVAWASSHSEGRGIQAEAGTSHRTANVQGPKQLIHVAQLGKGRGGALT